MTRTNSQGYKNTGASKAKKAKKPPRGALALVGAWRDVPDTDIDGVLRRIYSARRHGKARNVDLND